jgi:hypothetical protein
MHYATHVIQNVCFLRKKKKMDRHVCGIVKKTLEKIGTFVSPTFGALTLGEDGSPEALRSA